MVVLLRSLNMYFSKNLRSRDGKSSRSVVHWSIYHYNHSLSILENPEKGRTESQGDPIDSDFCSESPIRGRESYGENHRSIDSNSNVGVKKSQRYKDGNERRKAMRFKLPRSS